MSEPTPGAPASAPLQFDTVLPAGSAATPAGMACTLCQRGITDAYHQANGKIVCSACRAAFEAQMARGGSVAKAAALGAGGGLLGAAVWYGVAAITGYEIGLIAVLMGWLVGRGVNLGSNGRGGRGYQVLALALTYLSICAAYAPLLLGRMSGEGVGPAGALVISLAAPVLAGISSPIFLIIAGVGFLEAWRQNRPVEVHFTGPHAVMAAAPEAAPAVV